MLCIQAKQIPLLNIYNKQFLFSTPMSHAPNFSKFELVILSLSATEDFPGVWRC